MSTLKILASVLQLVGLAIAGVVLWMKDPFLGALFVAAALVVVGVALERRS